MSKLVWRFGDVRIRVTADGPRKLATSSSDLKAEEWRVRRGWSSGPFTIHVVEADGIPLASLSHKRTGCRIHLSSSLLLLFELAERLAELDWSGRIEEFTSRNAEAVTRLRREVREAARREEAGS